MSAVLITGPRGRTWRVTSAVWDGKPARSPFESITFFADGTWRDSSGVSGDWRFCLRSGSLAFEPHGFDVLIRATALRRSADEVVIEFANHSPGMFVTLVQKARDQFREPEAEVESCGTSTATPQQRTLMIGER